MGQLTIPTDAAFETALARFMRQRGLSTVGDALRVAIEEGVARTENGTPPFDYRNWIGMARREPVNPSPQFRSDDDLWEP